MSTCNAFFPKIYRLAVNMNSEQAPPSPGDESAAMDTDAVGEALKPLRQMLQSDGYDVVISPVGDGMRLAIVAMADACEDCLVPRTVMEPFIADAFREHEISRTWTLVYPGASPERDNHDGRPL